MDPIAMLRLAIDLAKAIEKAADDAQQNTEDCKRIKSSIVRVLGNLRELENNEQLLRDSAVSPTVEELGKILEEAQKLVGKCQVKRNIIRVLWKAEKLSRKLKQMNKRITDCNIDLMQAMTGYQVRLIQSLQKPVRAPPSSAPGGEMNIQPSSSHLHELVDIAGQITEAMPMVRQNKEDCFEIATRVGKLSAFLPRLENTEMMSDPELTADLKKLVDTFHHAQEVVTACQGSSSSSLLLACQGVVNVRKDRELSKELHEVLDQMVLDFDAITEISIRYTTGSPTLSISVTFTATHYIAKLLRLARQKINQRIALQSAGQTSQLQDASFKAGPEEIEELATESISIAHSSNQLHEDDPSLLQGGATTEAPGPSSEV